ncbi:hypothetical protein DL770_005357 [Monosporascus sp. CRB-9-2]|nr:hypothetical protein DL770_005357 [Monosporascus sp. CRB-9-2]
MEHIRVDPGGFHLPGMPPPPQLMNQPPQIFGTYRHDSLSGLPPDIAAQMAFDPTALLDDPNEAKRRRIARVSNESTLGFESQDLGGIGVRAKYIEGLENRLVRMESLLRLSGLLGDDDAATDLGTLEKKLAEKVQQQSRQTSHISSNPTSPSQATSAHDGVELTPRSSITSPEPPKDRDHRRDSTLSEKESEEVEALSEMMCSLVTTPAGETRYIGSSSGFSIFSPKGIEWVNQKTGDTSFQKMISDVSIDDQRWNNWKPEVFGDLFRRPIFRPLPSKPEAMSLLKDYFDNFNCMFPLFHQPTFMHLVERQYSADPYQGSGWWASLNCVLAIAYRLRVMSNLVPQEEDEKAWAHVKNALGVFAELTMRNTDLLSVQALLAIALFMQGTPNQQPSFVLVSAAIRLSHSIGLHKRGTGFNLNPIEIEQRKRVFWIAYMLDKDLCLRSGRPPTQDDDDMNVDLPDPDPADNIGNIPLADGKGKMNLFRAMCELTTIESRVYRRLYSTKATKLSDGELLQIIGELDKELEDWKDSIPIDFRPEHEIKASHTPLILHVVMLHFSYYNALTTIHRMSVHHGYWTSRLSNYAIQGRNTRPLNPRVFSSAALCASAARASISLLKYIPQGDFSCVWMALYFPVSALITLFGNILQNPLDPRAKSDTKLMNLVVTFLSTLGEEVETGGIRRMLSVCSEFEHIARVVIDKAEKESSKRKRKSHDPPKPIDSLTPSQILSSAATPTYDNSMGSQLSPKFHGEQNRQNNSRHNSPMTTTSQATSTQPDDTQGDWAQEFNANSMLDFGSFSELTGFGQPVQTPPTASGNGHFQPLLPQDVWQLPMTLDYDWAETLGAAYPGFENGSTMQTDD